MTTPKGWDPAEAAIHHPDADELEDAILASVTRKGDLE